VPIAHANEAWVFQQNLTGGARASCHPLCPNLKLVFGSRRSSF
jgi:hypothetical protein